MKWLLTWKEPLFLSSAPMLFVDPQEKDWPIFNKWLLSGVHLVRRVALRLFVAAVALSMHEWLAAFLHGSSDWLRGTETFVSLQCSVAEGRSAWVGWVCPQLVSLHTHTERHTGAQTKTHSSVSSLLDSLSHLLLKWLARSSKPNPRFHKAACMNWWVAAVWTMCLLNIEKMLFRLWMWICRFTMRNTVCVSFNYCEQCSEWLGCLVSIWGGM